MLQQAVGERVAMCAKVRLADVFFVAGPNENAAARNRIAAKHVDFLLCDPATMRPLAGIELDDASHARPDRQDFLPAKAKSSRRIAATGDRGGTRF